LYCFVQLLCTKNTTNAIFCIKNAGHEGGDPSGGGRRRGIPQEARRPPAEGAIFFLFCHFCPWKGKILYVDLRNKIYKIWWYI
jgi:hypothetical protein